ncbi:glycosyltransferase family protein [Kordiimonas aestuarii]|uniref:glycosyltransferase n=1 Tax=Kordiimonas aestuarii TaxID=1005925 RepID=UPI0021D387D8|nr:glycosyltransferase [Kordiimonas aestuarii]
MAKHQTVIGYIDGFEDGHIHGWLYSSHGKVAPIIRVNGFPARIVEYPVPRPDVAEAVRITHLCGFIAEPISLAFEELHVELLAVVNDAVVPVAVRTLDGNYLSNHLYAQLKVAKEVARQQDAVAITVWDGGHNPIGRAKVLYDIVQEKRPAVIFSFLFPEFGHQLWEPLRESGANVVTIPFHKRDQVFRYLAEEGVRFDTVWICKPRKHSFDLAQAISHRETACIVDLDDNEVLFASSDASRLKPYGRFSINLAENLLSHIPTRSCASKSLADKYKGTIVRHVRTPLAETELAPKSLENQQESENFRLIFFGSVKPHKGLIELANAINIFNFITSKKVELVVGGEFTPKDLKTELESLNVTCLDKVKEGDLPGLLANYDAVITGFPTHPAKRDITDYQISSKIGDALRVGLPALVPDTPSVADLDHLGIILFSDYNFVEKLCTVLELREKVELPPEFSTPYAYDTFLALEGAARQSPRAGQVFPYLMSQLTAQKASKKKKLVLVWKQHDAAMYGRRIDQIARYYACTRPEVEVYVIELLSDVQTQSFLSREASFGNEVELQNTMLRRKSFGYEQNNVRYHTIEYRDAKADMSFSTVFTNFLDAKDIRPSNSVFILYPFLQQFPPLRAILGYFKVLVDIVDNQSGWLRKLHDQRQYLKQIHEMGTIAEKIILNSGNNRDHLVEAGAIPEDKSMVITNWYWHPSISTTPREKAALEKRIIYTGNMNDRVNWPLLSKILNNVCREGVTLHLVGPCGRKPAPLEQLITHPYCVYHGMLQEDETIELASKAHVALICHENDELSKFMNPLKVFMYEAIGLPWVSAQIEGITLQNGSSHICENDNDLIQRLNTILERDKIQPIPQEGSALHEAKKYRSIIDEYLLKEEDNYWIKLLHLEGTAQVSTEEEQTADANGG